jgi:hypothetical protein
MPYYFLPILFSLWISSAFSQSKSRIVKAGSKTVTINDGGRIAKDWWTLSPEAKPDIFTADRTRKTKWVTFYTDIDSIRVKVKPGTRYNFVIVLNGKDSCYTQIASAIAPEEKTDHRKTPDTIPFILTAYNAIHVKALINATDTLNLHFDVGSFDFRFTKDAILNKTQLLPDRNDVLAGKSKGDYQHLNPVLSLKMGSMTWKNPEIVPTGLTAHDMDGRFGWNLFEGNMVEINYDKNCLIIHSELPKQMKGYVRSELEFMESFVCINGVIKIGANNYPGRFLMDTGSDQAMILDKDWTARQQFPEDSLKLIRSSTLKDPRGVSYETKIVEMPGLKLNGFELRHIPAYMLSSKNPVGFEVNYLGNDLLKRFNMILDFKNDVVYLKPNGFMKVQYRQSS